MRPFLASFLLIPLLLSACAPVFAPATATPTLTPAPTRTPTPAPTATATFTPTPEPTGVDVLGPELARTVRTDFEKYGYSLDNLTFQKSEYGAVALDKTGEVTGEEGKVVYETDEEGLGRFDIRFAVFNLDPDTLVSTPYEPDMQAGYPRYVFNKVKYYTIPLGRRLLEEFERIYGVKLVRFTRDGDNSDSYTQVVILNPEKKAYGLVLFTNSHMSDIGVNYFDFENVHPEEKIYFAYENKDGEMLIIPLIQYLRQLLRGRRQKSRVNSAQTGDLLENISQ